MNLYRWPVVRGASRRTADPWCDDPRCTVCYVVRAVRSDADIAAESDMPERKVAEHRRRAGIRPPVRP